MSKTKTKTRLKPIGPDNRPACYLETDPEGNERAVYRISGLGSCPRHLFRLLQPDHATDRRPPGLSKAAASGEMWEEVVKRHLEGDDVEIDDINPSTGDQYVVEQNAAGALLRGHIDGFATINDPEDLSRKFPNLARNQNLFATPRPKLLFEAKEMNDERWELYTTQGLAAFPSYCLQLSLYLKATGAVGALYAVGRRERKGMEPGADWSLSYIRNNDPCLPPYSDAIRQVMAVEKARKAGAGSMPDCTGKSFWCPFKKTEGLCTVDSNGKSLIKPLEVQFDDLEEMLLEERELASVAKFAAAAHDEAKEKLVHEVMKRVKAGGHKLEANQKLVAKVGGMTIQRPIMKRFASELLKIAHPDIYNNPAYWTSYAQVRVYGYKGDEGGNEADF